MIKTIGGPLALIAMAIFLFPNVPVILFVIIEMSVILGFPVVMFILWMSFKDYTKSAAHKKDLGTPIKTVRRDDTTRPL